MSMKAIGTWSDLLRDTANATYDNNMANDLSQGNLFGAICSPLQWASAMAQPPIVTCSPDGTYCIGSATGALHPLTAGSFGLPYQFPFTDITLGDVVQGDVLAATVTTSCNSTANFTLWANDDPPTWAQAEAFVNVSLQTDSGNWSTITAGSGYGIIYQAPGLPEIGVLPLAATDEGGFMMVLFAKDFQDDFRGFQQFQDPIRGRRLGLTLCTTDISVGTAAMQTEVVFTTPTVVTQIKKVETKGPMSRLHIGRNFGLYAVIQAVYYYLNCYYWYCPQTPVVPMFDRQCGLLAQPVIAGAYDYDGQQATAISALIRTTVMQFAAFELVTSADPNNTLSMVPVQVFTKSTASRLITSRACNAILCGGLIAAFVLIILHVGTDIVGRRYPALDHGLNITNSIYSLLSAFQSVPGGGGGGALSGKQSFYTRGDSDPQRTRERIRGRQLTLTDAELRERLPAAQHEPRSLRREQSRMSFELTERDAEACCRTGGGEGGQGCHDVDTNEISISIKRSAKLSDREECGID
ncbi:hypothetical protein HDU87_005750 [Geranomyces variabilis]|uniref:Uncharacterized protein n=1 Tax=Geranomyces variabilis TaxID=109894 RepID=A0AAD5TIQ8_9FUNG|nr:hypothetical protein HDU87_005750 [Geranomyces variabilis]